MSRRLNAFNALFDCYKREGKELGLMELKRKYPREVANLRKVSAGSDINKLLSRMKNIYADRWHEIFENKINIVHEKPVKQVSEPNLSPLERLKKVSRKANE